MDGRHPEAVRLTLTACLDPAQEAAFNAWYDRVHVGDILAGGVATHATRFIDADPGPTATPYLALYELPSTNLERMHQSYADLVRRLTAQGRMFDQLQIGRRSMWRRTGARVATVRPGQAPTAGLFIIESNCTVPERQHEFNEWYDRTHIPDLLATGLFCAAHRFAAMAGQEGGTYLAIYETLRNPRDAVEEFSWVHRPKLKAAGRLSDIIDITWRGIFRRLDSADHARSSEET